MSLLSCNEMSVHIAAFIGCSIVRDYTLVSLDFFARFCRVFIVLCNDRREYLSLWLTRPIISGATRNIFLLFDCSLSSFRVFSLLCMLHLDAD